MFGEQNGVKRSKSGIYQKTALHAEDWALES